MFIYISRLKKKLQKSDLGYMMILFVNIFLNWPRRLRKKKNHAFFFSVSLCSMSGLLLLTVVVVLIVATVALNSHLTEHFGGGCMDLLPFARIGNHPLKQGAIFLSVASYRDRECTQTIESAFHQAKHPELLFVGVCEQNKDKSESCTCCPEYAQQIRTKHLTHTEAKGPTYARYWCSLLWEGEEWFLQVDSHMKFTKAWDEKCREMMREIGSLKAVVSAYPPTPGQMKTSGSPVMCSGKFSGALPSFKAGWAPARAAPFPSPKPFAAAGFLLVAGTFLRDVPFDPYLPHLFQGEEILLSARLWTHGYDFYTPNLKVCSHDYGRKGSPKFWNDDNNTKCRARAEMRAKYILGVSPKDSVLPDFLVASRLYGLGKTRSLKSFWKKAGLNFKTKTITDSCAS